VDEVGLSDNESAIARYGLCKPLQDVNELAADIGESHLGLSNTLSGLKNDAEFTVT
jgi:hypothetical protein